jgi:hypothetical protein
MNLLEVTVENTTFDLKTIAEPLLIILKLVLYGHSQ